MSETLTIQCSCTCEILVYQIFEGVGDEGTENWFEIVQKWWPRGFPLRERIRAFRGRDDRSIVLEPDDARRLRDFLVANVRDADA